MREDVLGGAGLDDQPVLQHHNVVGGVPDHPEVVGDQHNPEPALRLQLVQQVEHLRLDGGVQRGDGLVREQHGGFHRERPSNGDALPLTAGQRPRSGARGGGVQMDGFQQVGDPLRIAPPQCIGEHLAHVPARFEGSQRILDDHGQLTSARSPSPFG